MRSSDEQAKAKPLQSKTRSPVLFPWLNQSLKMRPWLAAYETHADGANQQVIWTPTAVTVMKYMLWQKMQQKQYQMAYYQMLTQYAREHGTSQAYEKVLETIQHNYDQVEKQSTVGSLIGQHSKSMMPTFQSAGSPALPAFSLALSRNSLLRAPAPLSDSAAWYYKWLHGWKFIQGYTQAHNDAYKDLKIDRHFTPAWLTAFVIFGKGMTNLVPKNDYVPVDELYGKFTGNMALLFNPAKDYDSSDFATRTLLYTGMTYPFLRGLTPRLFIASATLGNKRLRIMSFAASLLTGGAYEFFSGYKAGTSYMTRPVDYITSVEEEE